MFAELETECGKEAVSQSEPKSLPAPFSAQKLSGERGGGIRKVEISTNVLDTAATLKRNGMQFCVAKFSIKSEKYTVPYIDVQYIFCLCFFPQGIKTGIVANIWVDDSPQRDSVAKMLSVLESCFDVVVQSCHIGSRLPEPEIFHTALAELNVKPHEACISNWGPVTDYDCRVKLILTGGERNLMSTYVILYTYIVSNVTQISFTLVISV